MLSSDIAWLHESSNVGGSFGAIGASAARGWGAACDLRVSVSCLVQSVFEGLHPETYVSPACWDINTNYFSLGFATKMKLEMGCFDTSMTTLHQTLPVLVAQGWWFYTYLKYDKCGGRTLTLTSCSMSPWVSSSWQSWMIRRLVCWKIIPLIGKICKKGLTEFDVFCVFVFKFKSFVCFLCCLYRLESIQSFAGNSQPETTTDTTTLPGVWGW